MQYVSKQDLIRAGKLSANSTEIFHQLTTPSLSMRIGHQHPNKQELSIIDEPARIHQSDIILWFTYLALAIPLIQPGIKCAWRNAQVNVFYAICN